MSKKLNLPPVIENETPFDRYVRLNGYAMALQGIVQKISELTGRDPEKRKIDAVELLDAISLASDEITSIMERVMETIKKEHAEWRQGVTGMIAETKTDINI